jgi:hypothetical protein
MRYLTFAILRVRAAQVSTLHLLTGLATVTAAARP